MNIILIPAISSGHHNYINPNPSFDQLTYLTRIVDSIHARLCQIAKDTPFITISKLTGTIDQITAQLIQLNQTPPPSANCIVAVGLNSTNLDGRYHTATGWSLLKSSQSKQSAKLATAFTTAAIQALKQRAASTDPNQNPMASLNQIPILTATPIPAVLTLNLYQDNQKDIAYLLSDRGRQAIIDLHVKGILAYASRLNPGNTPPIRQANARPNPRHRKSGSADSQSRNPT